MKTQLTIAGHFENSISTPLHGLVNRISESLAPATRLSKSHIINNVSEGVYVEVNEDKVASVLSLLLNIVIANSENSCVRISSKIFGNVVLLHIKDDGCLNYDSISHSLSHIQAQAEKLGGFVGFTSYRNKLTTIAFSFTNCEKNSISMLEQVPVRA